MSENTQKSTFPQSWFRVASSKELPPKKVIPLRYFGKDLVLFRTEDGTPYLLDAYCPHLGAHLAYGGTIQGQNIRCPYHGWLWDGKGHCVEFPYQNISKKPQVTIHSYPVREVNGLIFMYYHQQQETPPWEITEIPECYSPEWTPLSLVKRWRTRTNINSYLENSVDVAHLSLLHQQTFKAAKSDRIEVNDHVFVHQMSQKYNLSSLAAGKLISEDGSVITTYYGPGYDVSFYQTEGRVKLSLMQIFTGTPIDEEYLDIAIFFSVKKVLPQPLNIILTQMLKQDTIDTFEQDIPILENKHLPVHSLIYEEDGPILQCRRWLAQFYQ